MKRDIRGKQSSPNTDANGVASFGISLIFANVIKLGRVDDPHIDCAAALLTDCVYHFNWFTWRYARLAYTSSDYNDATRRFAKVSARCVRARAVTIFWVATVTKLRASLIVVSHVYLNSKCLRQIMTWAKHRHFMWPRFTSSRRAAPPVRNFR